jgi:hypothetical protein
MPENSRPSFDRETYPSCEEGLSTNACKNRFMPHKRQHYASHIHYHCVCITLGHELRQRRKQPHNKFHSYK